MCVDYFLHIANVWDINIMFWYDYMCLVHVDIDYVDLACVDLACVDVTGVDLVYLDLVQR